MLDITDENGVEDPVESDHNVQDHRSIVNPHAAEGQYLAQKWMLCVRVAQTPVHDQIPDRRVDSVQKAEGDEGCLKARVQLDAVHAQGGVIEDTKDILPQVEEMGERISGVHVSTNALEGSPYRWEGGEEPQEPRMRGVALDWVIPVRGIEAEEELDVLDA